MSMENSHQLHRQQGFRILPISLYSISNSKRNRNSLILKIIQQKALLAGEVGSSIFYHFRRDLGKFYLEICSEICISHAKRNA